MSGEWGTITDSDWTDNDARVVCRKLGHFRPGKHTYSIASILTFFAVSYNIILLYTEYYW